MLAPSPFAAPFAKLPRDDSSYQSLQGTAFLGGTEKSILTSLNHLNLDFADLVFQTPVEPQKLLVPRTDARHHGLEVGRNPI